MESILASIRPRWCEMIFDGRKTIEVRKTRPKVPAPFLVYVYETKGFERVGNDNLNCIVGGHGHGAVIGEFVCDWADKYSPGYAEFAELAYGSLVLPSDLYEYSQGQPIYGWHITNPKLYDTPRLLTNYHRPCPEGLYCESCAMHSEHPAPFCGNYALEIRRPPQSWMYAVYQT